MKILQLCNKVPYPPKDGGAIAILTLSESFTQLGHQVTVLAMNTVKHKSDIKAIPSYFTNSIKFVFVNVDTHIKPFRLFLNFVFSKVPYIAERFIDKGFTREIIKLLSEDEFDIIQLEGLYLTPYIPVVRKYSSAKIAYRSHNIEHEIWNRVANDTTNIFKRIFLFSLSARLKVFEHNMINSYDILVPITARDEKILIEMSNLKPSYVCAAGVPDRNFNKQISYTPNSLFYIGALDWMPNQESICWFIDYVWVSLIEKIPGLQFHIAGRNSPLWLQKKCNKPGIIFHGEIDNAHNFFDQYQIMVVPLFSGSGMRLKIVEAMARSKVVITTSIGAEGLEVKSGVHLIIENTPEGFIEQISFLLENPETFTKIEKEAFKLASDKYNCNSITAGLTGFYKQQIEC